MLTHSIDEQNKILEITISGKITRDELTKVINDFRSPFENWDEIRILKRVDSFSGIELMALIDDFKFLFSNLDNMKKIKKAALVTDKEWIEKISEVMISVLPYESKIFENEDIEDARAWLK
jgi:hypothetical protein